ncbi:LamG-like jellyroll fold domain-containing protein [Nakamurella lactea]|uniref:LamG-like jellyroll fold domain-containing protein n=1 Tax=Nakamurella lactea TaxID=459515 RepID=UPI000429DAA0|nr:LamG-like jellyroll fold domain-containing protein [Nakamurella lactea]
MTHRSKPPTRGRRRVIAAALALIVTGVGLQPALAAAAAPAPTVTPKVTAAAPAAGDPAADVLDIGFADGVAHDAAQNIASKAWGAPSFDTDQSLRAAPTGILRVDGVDDAVSFEVDPWSTLATGFTVECVFRVDAALPVSGEHDLCSDKESGGFSIYLNGSNLGTMAHIGGAYKSVTTPVKSGRWYHALSVWDGNALTLYVNGAAAASTPAAGALQPPAASSRRFVVGGDAAPAGVGQLAPASSYAAAAVYGSPVDAARAGVLADRWNTAPATPAADVLDVDFADGTPVDRAQNLTVTTSGGPQIGNDSALGTNVGTFDGADDSYAYAFGDQWSKISTSVSIECTFRYNGPLPASAEKDLCSSKESGGYSIVIYDDELTFTAYVGGGYHAVATTIVPGRWYHAVGTWDGTTERLFVDGELAKEAPLAGALGLPSSPARNFFFVGADSLNQFYAPATIRNARVFSTALTATEIGALNIAALGEYRDAGVELVGTVPAGGTNLTSPVDFAVDVTNPGNATGWTYLLDDQVITPGQRIGAGLKAGKHRIVITAADVFGKALRWEVPFSSAAIPVGGGVDTGQGHGTVTLSAIATDPDGGKVTTTFDQATASVAEGGFSGVVPVLPSALEFTYTEGATLTGRQITDGVTATSPSTGQIPFQRFDVQVPADGGERQLSWSGIVDPERSVSLRAWNPTAAQWVELATARGAAEGDTTLVATVRPALVDGTAVHVLITGEDPFADDISARDASAGEAVSRDHFDDPDDYDFSLVHFTDTQYISEGAAGGTYDDWDGVTETSDVELAEEQAVWAQAYHASTKWIADNAADKKIAYTAHTGDVIENDISDPSTRPGLNAQVDKELAFASIAQQTLDDSGMVNQVIAGNHDNQSGNETGSASRFSQTFSANRYYDGSQKWPAQEHASYHAWDETTDANGTTVTRGKDNQNNYVLFSAGGLDFVAVGLSYGVTADEATWATSIFQRYHDRNGILITHAYLAPSNNADGRGAGFSTDGSRLYDQVVAANPNVFLVLAGHEHGVGTNLKSDVGVTVSHNVVELLADYQFYTVSAAELFPDKLTSNGDVDLNGDGVADHRGTDQLQFGASFLRLLQFDVARSEMSVDTYSPLLDNFGATEYDTKKRYNGAEDNMVLPVDLTSRTTSFATDGLTVVSPTDTVIGEATARSGWPASVSWSGLTQGQVYAWTSTSRTGSGDLVGSINQVGGVFVATAAGTDTVAPVLTVPAQTSVSVGDTFDPLAGVTAVDNTDGDVTGAISVVGSVDTRTPGSYPLTYLVADTNGNQAVAPRVVTVTAPTEPELKASSVKVRNIAATFGKDVKLTATVVPAAATGTVAFLTGEETWCQATISRGVASCVVRALPSPGQSYSVTAFYSGDDTYRASDASFVLSVAKGSFIRAPKPKISGPAKVGSTLTARVGKWKPAAAFSYQWYAGAAKLAGATKSTYRVAGTDRGKALSVVVTGHAAGYTDTSVRSDRTPIIRR